MMLRLALLCCLLAILAGLAAREVDRRWRQPLPIPAAGHTLTVAAGDSLRAVTASLHREGVLPYPRLLQAYGRWTGLDAEIKQGEYLLPPGITAADLLLLLREGRVIQYLVTLPEGISLARAVAILRSHPRLEQELTGARDPRIAELVRPHTVAEGLFFPDSYRFERGASDWQILQRAYRAMQVTLAEEWAGRAGSLPYESPYEALIMASIVERETGLAEERGEIAGVFVRRLAKGMRLQTDPTVIYGLGEDFDGNLRRVHLQDAANPYNTYRHGGLPPSPIALPGRAAIHAALHPLPGDSLYFVARGDGGHAFSATLEQHQRAVRKYQLQRRENYRSSPGDQ